MTIFEVLREQVPIEEVVGGRVGGKVLCPAHADGTKPNLHIYDDHVYCFACEFRGDVTAVWAALRGFDRQIEAARDLARERRIQVPESSPEAERKAEARREKEDLYLKQARACHRVLEKHSHVCNWWEGRGFGEELRERFLLGANKDGTAAVIPFWHRGRVQGLIRRPLDGKPDKYLYPKIEEFAGGYRPLFIPGPVRAGAFLVEGIIDALAVAALGESAIAVGGTGISPRQLEELQRLAGPLYILPDDDEEGAEAARKWTRELYPKAFLCPASYRGEATHA